MQLVFPFCNVFLSLCGLEAPYHFNIINLGEAAEEDVDIHHRGRICITDREHTVYYAAQESNIYYAVEE
jgi:hypothetical protein